MRGYKDCIDCSVPLNERKKTCQKACYPGLLLGIETPPSAEEEQEKKDAFVGLVRTYKQRTEELARAGIPLQPFSTGGGRFRCPNKPQLTDEQSS